MNSGMNFARKAMLPALMVFAMLLAACGSNGTSTGVTSSLPAKAPDKQQVLVWPISGVQDIATLDPNYEQDVYSGQATGMIFNNLVAYNDKATIVPDLAQSYSVSPDGLTWTFHLRPNIKFSDGAPVTSQDVAFSIDRALQPATKSPLASTSLAPIKDAVKLNSGKIKTIIGDSLLTPDPQTIVIITSTKAAYFLDALTSQNAVVFEKSFMQKYGAQWQTHLAGTPGDGAGPWMLQSYTHGRNLTFVPNPYYYGKKPQFRKVVMPLYANFDTTYKDYQVNRVDFSFVPTQQLAGAKALPHNQLRMDPALNSWYLSMNFLDKPFDNIKIRQAFALAINKDLIASKVYKGTVIPTNHIIVKGVMGYNPDLTGPAGVKSTAGDPVLAKKLLQEGLQEEGLTLATLPPISFEVAPAGSQDLKNMFDVLQQMWQNVLGINVKMREMDFNQLVNDITPIGSTQVMAAGIGWNASPDPEGWMTLQFNAGAYGNFYNFGQNHASDAVQQQHAQQLMVQADATVDNVAERMKLYDEAEQQVVNDVAWLPIYQGEAVYAVKPCVVNWPHNSFGQFSVPYQADWANMYISTDGPCANTTPYQ
jgi:oligopeptide transport system substrate-binding protein